MAAGRKIYGHELSQCEFHKGALGALAWQCAFNDHGTRPIVTGRAQFQLTMRAVRLSLVSG